MVDRGCEDRIVECRVVGLRVEKEQETWKYGEGGMNPPADNGAGSERR